LEYIHKGKLSRDSSSTEVYRFPIVYTQFVSVPSIHAVPTIYEGGRHYRTIPYSVISDCSVLIGDIGRNNIDNGNYTKYRYDINGRYVYLRT